MGWWFVTANPFFYTYKMDKPKPVKKKYRINPNKKNVKLSTIRGSFDLSKEYSQAKLKLIYELVGSKFIKYE